MEPCGIPHFMEHSLDLTFSILHIAFYLTSSPETKISQFPVVYLIIFYYLLRQRLLRGHKRMFFWLLIVCFCTLINQM